MTKCEQRNCDNDGMPVIDPYRQELYGENVLMRLCEDCLQNRREDI